MTFREIAVKYKYSIALILLFVLIENVSFIIEPTFFGNLPDSLIDHFYDHEKIDYIFPLIIWIVVYLINVVVRSDARGDEPSKMLVRAELVKEYIIFFKERLPEIMWQLSATAGAIIALFFYDYRIALVCLLVVIPIAYINNLSRNNVTRLQKDVHDNQEELFSLMESLASVKDLNTRFSKEESIA